MRKAQTIALVASEPVAPVASEPVDESDRIIDSAAAYDAAIAEAEERRLLALSAKPFGLLSLAERAELMALSRRLERHRYVKELDVLEAARKTAYLAVVGDRMTKVEALRIQANTLEAAIIAEANSVLVSETSAIAEFVRAANKLGFDLRSGFADKPDRVRNTKASDGESRATWSVTLVGEELVYQHTNGDTCRCSINSPITGKPMDIRLNAGVLASRLRDAFAAKGFGWLLGNSPHTQYGFKRAIEFL